MSGAAVFGPDLVQHGAGTQPQPTPFNPSDVVDVEPIAFELPLGGTTVLESLLARIPAEPPLHRKVDIRNFAVKREILALELPAPDAASEVVRRYMIALFPVFLDKPQLGTLSATALSRLGLRSGPGALAAYDYLGFDARNVDQSIVATGDGRGIEVTVGRFDQSAIQSALERCSANCISPQEARYAGFKYYTWEQDAAARLLDMPPLFARGPRRVLVQNDTVYDTRSDSEMRTVIDTIQGEWPSLLDFEDFALVGRALAGMGVNSAIITDQRLDLDSQLPPHTDGSIHPVREAASTVPLLRPFGVAGVGMGFDGKQNYAALALHHDSEAMAEDNARRLVARVQDGIAEIREIRSGNENRNARTYWRELVDRIVVGTSGRLLLARLYFREQLRIPFFPDGNDR